MIIGRRGFLTSAFVLNFVEKCPVPKFDTGCTFCQVPDLPHDKQIDFDTNLKGTTADHWKHVLIVSKQSHTDWPSKIELVPNSLAAELSVLKKLLASPYHPIVISNIDLGRSKTKTLCMKEEDENTNTVLIYPEGKLVRFTSNQTEDFFRKYLVPEEKIEQVYNPFVSMKPKELIGKEAEIYNSSFDETTYVKSLITICGHGQRDVRCGVIAPLVKDEIDRVLTKRNLVDDVDVGYISHIGGHVYAGNMIIFNPNKFEFPVWYGRVFPDKVQGIVEETIVKGNIVRELYRL